jgi:hypothetical protein
MLSIGAWQSIRHVRNFHFSVIPEWYQPHAPHQVGHAVSLDFDLEPVAPCVAAAFCDPVSHPEPLHLLTQDLHRSVSGQHYLIADCPRGPPVLL